MVYAVHIEHDPSLLYPVRLIELTPPRRYDVDPRPSHSIRYHYEVDEEEERRFARSLLWVDSTPGEFCPTCRLVTEYAHWAIMTTWHTMTAEFDEHRQQYVRVGYYEERVGWWWSRECVPPAELPEDVLKRLTEYDHSMAAAMEWSKRFVGMETDGSNGGRSARDRRARRQWQGRAKSRAGNRGVAGREE